MVYKGISFHIEINISMTIEVYYALWMGQGEILKKLDFFEMDER